MKKILIQLVVLMCSAMALTAQNLELKWSDQFIYDNKLDGFFDSYLGTNSNYIYAKFSNLSTKPKKRDKKMKLLAFDKVSMKKVGELDLKGYDGDKYDDMNFYKSIILDNVVYLVWTKEKKGTAEIYAESFDAKLKRVNKLMKVYELTKGKNGYDNFFIVSNRDVNNRIIVAKEFAATKDNENLRVEYKLLNSDFSVASSNQVTLPVLIDKKRKGLFMSAATGFNSFSALTCSYEFGDDGYLYIQDMIRLEEEDRKSLKKGEAWVYPHIMQVNLDGGRVQEYHVKFMNKNTFNFSTKITKKGIRLYGFFSDLDKDPKGRDSHGIFYISLDQATFKPTDVKFSAFSKEFLDELYAADKENQKKGSGLFKSKKAKASDDQSIDDNYIIERVIDDGTDIVLFCSIMRNWKETHCTTSSNGATTCYTNYYCSKSNVTAFKLNAGGDIVWAKNLDRRIVYPRWYVYDLNVIKDADTYYVVYGSAYQINAKKKNMSSTKSKKQKYDRFEYATFSSSTAIR